jgi:hypothetical protein
VVGSRVSDGIWKSFAINVVGAPDAVCPPRYAECGAVAATVGAAVVVAGVAGAGAAATEASMEVETGEVVTGVTTSCAVTEPLTLFF